MLVITIFHNQQGIIIYKMNNLTILSKIPWNSKGKTVEIWSSNNIDNWYGNLAPSPIFDPNI